MKKLTRSFALLIAVFAITNSLWKASAQSPGFQYGFLNVFQTNALDYVVEQVNIIRYDEGNGVKYWKPVANGTEARLTLKFPFSQPASQIALNAYMSIYNGSGTLWGSTNGTDWILLKTAIQNGDGAYEGNLPISLTRSMAIWIQARLQSSGSTIYAQFLRHDDRDTNNVFNLAATFNPVLSIEVAAVRLGWFAASNITYQVQWSTNLNDWSNLVSVIGTGGNTNVVDWTDGPRKFYRCINQ